MVSECLFYGFVNCWGVSYLGEVMKDKAEVLKAYPVNVAYPVKGLWNLCSTPLLPAIFAPG